MVMAVVPMTLMPRKLAKMIKTSPDSTATALGERDL
jgi:hypothetical protein